MIEAYFTDTMTWSTSPTLDKWGEVETPGTNTLIKCRAEERNQLVRAFSGEESLSTLRVFIAADIMAQMDVNGGDTFEVLQISGRKAIANELKRAWNGIYGVLYF